MDCLITKLDQSFVNPDLSQPHLLPNESILNNPSRSKFINTWDVAIFRGGSDGLLHRSPDAALNGTSIMMRLDHEYFWNEVFEMANKENVTIVFAAGNKSVLVGLNAMKRDKSILRLLSIFIT